MSKLNNFLKEAITNSTKPDQLDNISDVLSECIRFELLTGDEVGELSQQITDKRILICQVEQAK
jgi:hypothetical protein